MTLAELEPFALRREQVSNLLERQLIRPCDHETELKEIAREELAERRRLAAARHRKRNQHA